jgi:hypothetical protein
MQLYYIFITAMLESYQDQIISGMVKKGYMIGPASKDGKIAIATKYKSPSVLLVLSVYRNKDYAGDKIYADIVLILTDIKAYYYSVIVSESADSIWGGSNIILPDKEDINSTTKTITNLKKNIN